MHASKHRSASYTFCMNIFTKYIGTYVVCDYLVQLVEHTICPVELITKIRNSFFIHLKQFAICTYNIHIMKRYFLIGISSLTVYCIHITHIVFFKTLQQLVMDRLTDFSFGKHKILKSPGQKTRAIKCINFTKFFFCEIAFLE